MKSLKNIAMIAILILLAAVMLLAEIDYRLYVTYVVFAVSIIAFLAFTVLSFTVSTGKNVATLAGAGVLVGLMILFYFITPTKDVPVEMYEKTSTGMGWSPIIGAGLFTVYALMALFVALLAFFGVKNLIK